ncbi:nucleotide-sugar transporter-domain-containing protein [Absidia repens]|uniref:Nucleotide-sugar transporter-domain-containing protein n=1 Tax=Absidia repens TaxID=90262 RepID=A0A1X2IXT3_9FUNG|nr:nucleotide-sugar transporter-domain-containing protein [Absidia repens]
MNGIETRRTFQKTNASSLLPLTTHFNPTTTKRHDRLSTQHHPSAVADDRRILGLTMQHLSLVVLVIQNSILVLVMRQSRRPPLLTEDEDIDPLSALANDNPPPMYLASTAVFLAEVIKLVCCTGALYYYTATTRMEKGLGYFLKRGLYRQVTCSHEGISDGGRGILLMMIPSGLYALQNNLLYVALSHLEAATFQVTYQLKILSTAIFSILLLDRRLGKHQWVALFLLMAGVTMVQLSTSTTVSTTTIQGKKTGTTWIGVMAVLASCISSGFAGCYFERILKSSSPTTTTTTATSGTCSIWVRNIQLGICGSVFSFLGMVIYDRHRILENGFFQGYNGMTCWVIMNQALGGLVVSMVMVYADNILKAFATSLSIILSSIISVYLFDFQPTYSFIIGTFIVLLSTYLYGHRPSSVYKPD